MAYDNDVPGWYNDIILLMYEPLGWYLSWASSTFLDDCQEVMYYTWTCSPESDRHWIFFKWQNRHLVAGS